MGLCSQRMVVSHVLCRALCDGRRGLSGIQHRVAYSMYLLQDYVVQLGTVSMPIAFTTTIGICLAVS